MLQQPTNGYAVTTPVLTYIVKTALKYQSPLLGDFKNRETLRRRLIQLYNGKGTASTAEHLNLRVLNRVFVYNFWTNWTNSLNVNRLHPRLADGNWSLGIAFSKWPTIPSTPSTLTGSHGKRVGRKRPWLRNPRKKKVRTIWSTYMLNDVYLQY